MARCIPPRDYFTFAELRSRWNRTENDVRYAIIRGAIRPCIRLVGKHKLITWEVDQGQEGGWVEIVDHHDDDFYGGEIDPKGWQFLQDPVQTGPFDCQFRLATDLRDPDKAEYPVANWHLLKVPMTIEDVKINAVFLHTEVDSYEASYPKLSSKADPQSLGQKGPYVEKSIDPADLPEELQMANLAFRAVTNGYGGTTDTFRNCVICYLNETYPHLRNEEVKRIATVVNPDKSRGRKKLRKK